MSDAAYLAICLASTLAGVILNRWCWPFVGLALWGIAVGIADVAGAFEPTAEDNGLGVFVFTAVPALYWVIYLAVGIALRRVVSHLLR